ncbi:MAG: UvrD-helicase domain-containing protein [Candidatus Microthrix sp.]|nr:UvrD-helicase domain-containing protein [Candidatus Microthrix sp.]
MAAIASPLERIFIEAEPGSGKTTVAALRFGALRFGTAAAIRQSQDPRAVIGLSFTRSATAELRGRVPEEWGGRLCAGSTASSPSTHSSTNSSNTCS